MPVTYDRIVVVGGSLAGLRAAEALREQGFGGKLTIVADERRPPYNRPPLSKGLLTGHHQPADIVVTPLRHIEARWLLGRSATSLDLHRGEITLDGGESVHFDGLVIATGARPRRLPGVISHPAGVHVLRTLDDALALRAALLARPRRVAVLGGGFIGAEVASTVRSLDIAVSLVDAVEVPLAGAVGEPLARWLLDRHRHNGVDVHLGTPAGELVTEQGRVCAVGLADGTMIEADIVVVGLGVTPSTEWLAGSGLRVEDGVLCDATLRAAGAPNVVAAGDVARWPHPLYGGQLVRIEHWSNANDQASAAARTLLRDPDTAEPFASLPSFWSHVHGAKIQALGLPHLGDANRVMHGGLDAGRFVIGYSRAGRLVGAVSVGAARQLLTLRPHIEASATLADIA